MTTLNQSPTTKEQFSPKSSFIALVEYDKAKSQLDITFKTGSLHRYVFVFPTVYQSFKESPNHSVYYAKAIKGKLKSIKLISKTIGHKHTQINEREKLKK